MASLSARMIPASLAILAFAAMASAAQAMSAYKWKYRPLVVFADGASEPHLARQRSIVRSLRPAFSDRGMIIVYVVGDRVTAELGPPPGQTAAALRRRFGVSAGFRAVLVGKDGGVKLSATRPFSGLELFDTIDAMPMRRDEMRSRR